MNAPNTRAWKKIACFYTLTMLFAGVFDAFVLHAAIGPCGIRVSIQKNKESNME